MKNNNISQLLVLENNDYTNNAYLKDILKKDQLKNRKELFRPLGSA